MKLNIEEMSKEELNELKKLILSGRLLNEINILIEKTDLDDSINLNDLELPDDLKEESKDDDDFPKLEDLEMPKELDDILNSDDLPNLEWLELPDIEMLDDEDDYIDDTNLSEKLKKELISYFNDSQNKDFDNISLKDKISNKLGLYISEYMLLDIHNDIPFLFSSDRKEALKTIIMQLVYKQAELEGYSDEEVINIYTDNLELYIPCILVGENISITDFLNSPLKYLPRGIEDCVRERYDDGDATYISHLKDEKDRENEYNILRTNKEILKFKSDKTTKLYNSANFYENYEEIIELEMEEYKNDVTNILIEYYTKNGIDYTGKSKYENNYNFLVSSKYILKSRNFVDCNVITVDSIKEKKELFDLIDGREYANHFKR